MPSPAAEQEKVTEKQRELKLKVMLSSTLFSSLLATAAALGAVECWHLNTKLPFIDKLPKNCTLYSSGPTYSNKSLSSG